MSEGGLPTDDFRNHFANERRIRVEFRVLVRALVQGEHAAADGIACCVVSTDDQQHKIAEKLEERHVARGGRMSHHRDEVVLRLLVYPFVPQSLEIHRATDEFFAPRLVGFDDPGFRCRSCYIGPARQLAPLLPREIKQGCQRHRRQLDRNLIHPVEIFANREFIENLSRALADDRLEQLQVGRSHCRSHRLALLIVLGRVHRYEHFKFERAFHRMHVLDCNSA